MEENGEPEPKAAEVGTSEMEVYVGCDNEEAGGPPVSEMDEEEGDDGGDLSGSNVDQAAVLQLVFDSIDDAENFYLAYANVAGFRVRTQSVKSTNGELIKNKEFVCTREGFRKTPTAKEGYYRKRVARPETRCGCRARFRVAHERFSGKYIVTRFEPNHNHPLEPCKKSNFMSPSDKSMLTLMTDAGYRTCQVMSFLEHMAGGPGKLTFKKKDAYNYLHKIRTERSREGDAKTATPPSSTDETTNTRDRKRKTTQNEENSSDKLKAPSEQTPPLALLKRMKQGKFKNEVKLEHRTSLRKMVEINRKLEKPQIKAIEELGFGSMTRIQFDQIDRVLVRWLLERYDPDSNKLSLHDCQLTVDDEDISHALGIPKEGVKPVLDTASSDGLAKYETMFSVIDGKIDLSDLYEKLKQHEGSGDEFKVMYLTLVLGSVLFPGIHQNLPVHYLDLLVDLSRVKHINWAGLVRENFDNGIRVWKEKSTSYVAGCLLFFQVFFLARVPPRGSPHFIRLNYEIPFVDYLTRQRVTLLTQDMHNKGGYTNPKACWIEAFKRPLPTTGIQAKEKGEQTGTVQLDEGTPKAKRVGGEKVELQSDRGSSKSKGTGEEDKGTRALMERRIPVRDGESVEGEVKLDHGKSSSISKPQSEPLETFHSEEYVGADDDDDECNDDAVGDTGATDIDFEKVNCKCGEKKNTMPRAEGNEFLLQSQVTLLGSRVLALETQCAQLMSIVNELLSRQLNSGGGHSNPPSTSVGPYTNMMISSQEWTPNIPRPMNPTSNGTIPESVKNFLGQSVSSPSPFVSSKIGLEGSPSSADFADREDVGDFGKTPLVNQLKSPLPKISRQFEAEANHLPEKASDRFHFQMQRKSGVLKDSCPMNPMAGEDEVIQFLFNENRDLSEFIVDFGFYRANRSNILCLKPESFLNGTVIDCFAYWCTLEMREESPLLTPRWYFTAMFSQMALKDHISDNKIIKTFFEGEYKLTNDIRCCERIYIPINDLHEHWFLCIVDFNAKKIYICDTAHVEEMEQYRKRIVDKMIDRLEQLLLIWKPKDFRFSGIRYKFKYEYPDWVPRQKNGWDCGLHACMMMFDLGLPAELSEGASIYARRLIALQMYKSIANRFAWEQN